VAYLPETVAFHPALTGLEMVRFYVRLQGAGPGAAMGLLERVGLTEVEARTDRIVILSRGKMVANDTLAALRRSAALPTRLQVTAMPGAAERVGKAGSDRRVGPDDRGCRSHPSQP